MKHNKILYLFVMLTVIFGCLDMVTTSMFLNKTFISSDGTYYIIPEINPFYSHFYKLINIISFCIFSLVLYLIKPTKMIVMLNIITAFISMALVINNTYAIMLIKALC